MPRTSSDQLADNLHDVMMETLPSLVKEKVMEQVKKEVPYVYLAEGLILERKTTKEEMERLISKAIFYMSGHILYVYPAQVQSSSVPEQQHQLYLAMKVDSLSSSVRTRDQDDPHDDAHLEGENNDDEVPTKQVSQDIMEEVSLTINEAKLKKIESKKEILTSPHPRKTTPLVQSCQRDPEAPALSLINQDLLYLKKGSSGPEKIVLSLHKFPAIIFNDVDIEERTSRWVNKCVKKFNPYARYGVEHWKNPHAKIFYIKMQKEPGKPKEVVYSNSKIIQVIKTYWELGHEHKFITEIVVRRANECIVSITESDYKNLNKNDIEDMYLLIMNGKVPDYAETGIEKHKMFSIIYELVHGIIYKNSKKEKRVMRHSEIHKDLIEDEVEYLKLFEEEIEVRLKYRNQMRRWEMYVNGKPLGPRRERPE
ncbi:hypothetical protein Tco_0065622 [Tanacetum coccineum]